MPFVFKRLALLMSIAAAFAADKEVPFRAGAAASYSHQTSDQVTIGVDAYASGEKLRVAFGKLDPNQYGVLPVLVVIQNDSGKTLALKGLKVDYNAGGDARVEATPAHDIRYLNGVRRPTAPTPIKLPKKNPLDAWEIEGRAFVAQSLPSGNSASGFFYFQTALRPDATIYISGIREAATGKELLYFEVPLVAYPQK
jgi:hypothetical protein